MRLTVPVMDQRIARILAQVPGWDPSRAVVTPLEGGITNRNYRVEIGGEAFALRIGGEATVLLGIDRKNEFAAASIAARAGVGPEVVSFLEDESALITRFVAGQAVSPEAAARPEMLRRIIDSIRRIHQGPAFPGVFSPFETVRSYHALARERGVQFPESLPGALERMGRMESALGPPPRPVPCHNDLLATNFIDDCRTVRILDWEYAGMGDPFFDLGNFAANQRLSEKQCELVLRSYFAQAKRRDLVRLHLLRLASDLRESMWGFLQVGISKLDFDYPKYAREHLERFLKNAAGARFERWIEEASGACATKPGR